MTNTQSDLIVFYRSTFLILIKDVCVFRCMSSVLKEYGKKYGFPVEDLTGLWVNKNFLDYREDVIDGYDKQSHQCDSEVRDNRRASSDQNEVLDEAGMDQLGEEIDAKLGPINMEDYR